MYTNKLTCNFWPRVGQEIPVSVGSTSLGGALSPEFAVDVTLVGAGAVAAEDKEGTQKKTVLLLV